MFLLLKLLDDRVYHLSHKSWKLSQTTATAGTHPPPHQHIRSPSLSRFPLPTSITMTQMKESADIRAIKSLIQDFFDAINAADTKALGHTFLPNGTLAIIRQDPPRNPTSGSGSSGSGTGTGTAEQEDYYPQYAALPTPTGPPPTGSDNHDSNTTTTASEEQKISVIMRSSIEKFIKLIDEASRKRREGGAPDLKIVETPDLDATDVKVDALFGMAWSPFKVTFDGVLHHYGTIVYTLCKKKKEGEEDGWKIAGLTQNYRRAVGWEKESEFM